MTLDRNIRSGIERCLHWLNAAAVLLLIFSGWEIYNAAPFYAIRFPSRLTLGSDLTTALLWHFAAMWLFLGSLSGLLIRRLVFRRGVPLTPVSPAGVMLVFRDAAQGRLEHDLARYNAVQRLLYIGAFLTMIIAFASGLALWKPVQLNQISELFGGYEAARRWHFWAMASLSAFILIHTIMALLVPRTLAGMIFGIRIRNEEESVNERHR